MILIYNQTGGGLRVISLVYSGLVVRVVLPGLVPKLGGLPNLVGLVE